MYKEKILIGTMVPGGDAPNYIRQILPHGFESFEVNLGAEAADMDLERHAKQVLEVLGDSGAVVSSLGCYGNPLKEDDHGEQMRKAWAALIDAANLYGCDVVCGFTGRVVGRPLPDSIPRFKEVFGDLAKRAKDKGVRLAFENCPMGGDWQSGDHNIAHAPEAWELMFDAVPEDNLGLEWEPCHQMCNLIDPMAQLRKWVGKIFHLHGKDATVMWDVIREYGINGPKPFVFHRTPGFGDSNWTDIISELRRGGFEGAIDIEGWHDPVYREELEMTGQVHGLNYLKNCRTSYVENPK
jgi:sugar phosphate isomerase/epimerase